MQSAKDIARVAPASVFVCAAAAKTAAKKIKTALKRFMVLYFAASAAIRQMQDAGKCTEVTNWLIVQRSAKIKK
jgi:hypothetical protein